MTVIAGVSCELMNEDVRIRGGSFVSADCSTHRCTHTFDALWRDAMWHYETPRYRPGMSVVRGRPEVTRRRSKRRE
jgi:hypothetical protein